MNTNIQRLFIISMVFMLLVSSAAGIVTAQSDTGTQQTVDEQTQEQEQQEENREVRSERSNTKDISSTLTVLSEVWYKDGTVKIRVESRGSQTIDYFIGNGGDEYSRGSVTVEDGESVIYLSDVREGYFLWSGSEGKQFKPPSLSIFSLPPSEWVYSSTLYVGSIIGSVMGVIYYYMRLKYNKINTVQSIFNIRWW